MNPIVKVDKSKKVPVYTVRKILDDNEIKSYERRFLEESDFKIVLKSDADVYTEDGELLLRFRKNVLSLKHIDDAYEAMKYMIKQKTTDRGVASGSNKSLKTGQKKHILSNIMGYFDKWSIQQRSQFKKSVLLRRNVLLKMAAAVPTNTVEARTIIIVHLVES